VSLARAVPPGVWRCAEECKGECDKRALHVRTQHSRRRGDTSRDRASAETAPWCAMQDAGPNDSASHRRGSRAGKGAEPVARHGFAGIGIDKMMLILNAKLVGCEEST
jgi:hypothetical protein